MPNPTLAVTLKNCFGIANLEHEFDYDNTDNRSRAYAIYAPNGVMKTSFANTFACLAKSEEPKEERFNRLSSAKILFNDEELQAKDIHVLPATINYFINNDAVSNILVSQEYKKQYDSLMKTIMDKKAELLNQLSKISGFKKTEIEQKILSDFSNYKIFFDALKHILNISVKADYNAFKYAQILEETTLKNMQTQGFLDKAHEFTSRYQEVIEQSEGLYEKGKFNPVKANTAFDALEKQNYFDTGHLVFLRGASKPYDLEELKRIRNQVEERINADEQLKSIQTQLAKNAPSRNILEFLEQQSQENIDILLTNIQTDKVSEFKQQLWAYYLKTYLHEQAQHLLATYTDNLQEIQHIEKKAISEVESWQKAITLFNQRFIDMPYTLNIKNHADAVLGISPAKLVCQFKEGEHEQVFEVEHLESARLSQGEKRAFYLLNFIFEVESRKQSQQPTLFIIDDPADSFDYKNKHAILQYLSDLSDIDYFKQIILTHNFDFFRSLANSFVHRTRCLMANRTTDKIELTQAEGIQNIFIKVWRNKAHKNNTILCATIPFTRNIIEYTQGETNCDYLKLTSLLHRKQDTNNITVEEYWEIYTRTFKLNTSDKPKNLEQKVIDLIIEESSALCSSNSKKGLSLENKILLSMAIRLQAEQYMISRLSKTDPDSSWLSKIQKNQFKELFDKYKKNNSSSPALTWLEQVSVTVSSNIHINSFMYEPILDLGEEHLINLYTQVCSLCTPSA